MAEPEKVDIILYKIQFTPFKFDYWNNWHKKLVRKVCGVRFAYWLYYRNALTLRYTGKGLLADD